MPDTPTPPPEPASPPPAEPQPGKKKESVKGPARERQGPPPREKPKPGGEGSDGSGNRGAAKGLFDPNDWNSMRSFVVAAGVIGLLSFCFSTNLLLVRFSSQPQIVLQPAEASPDVDAQAVQSRERMMAQAQLVADIDQRQRAMQVQGMEKGLGIMAGTALIFFGGILLSLLFTETHGQPDSDSSPARAASPGAALMLAGALLIGWSTSKDVDQLTSFTSRSGLKFFPDQ